MKRNLKRYGICCLVWIPCALLFAMAENKDLYGKDLGEFSYPEKKHTEIAYADIPVTGVETETMSRMAEQMKTLQDQKEAGDEVKALCEDMITEYDRLSTQYTMAMNLSAADFSDEALSEEQEQAETTLYKAYDILMEGLKYAADGPYAEEIEDCFPDDSWLPYIRDYEPDTEEESAQLSEETELELAYYGEVGYDVTAVVEGEDWSFERFNETEDLSEEESTRILTALYQEENDSLGESYRQLVRSRTGTAMLYGYDNYAEYAYKELYDRDYSCEDIEAIEEAVKERLVPLYTELGGLLELLETEETDSLGNGDIEQIMSDIAPQIKEVSPCLEEAFQFLRDFHMVDADESVLRRDISYTVSLPYYGSAMIFSRMSGNYQDYQTMIHEFGHFNAGFHDPTRALFSYSVSDVDEIHSQALELLFMPCWTTIFPGECGLFMTYDVLHEMLYSVLDGMAVEEFEQTVYRNPDMTLDGINELMKKVKTDYGIYEDETDLYDWVEVTHLFDMPFYYTSYATSALASLEIWADSLADREAAVRKYLDITTFNGEYYFLDTLEICGIDNPLTENAVGRIAGTIQDYLEEAEETLQEAA